MKKRFFQNTSNSKKIKKITIISLCLLIIILMLFNSSSIVLTKIMGKEVKMDAGNTNMTIVVDPSTVDDYKKFFTEDNGTRYDGRIWTDKSVLSNNEEIKLDDYNFNFTSKDDANFVTVFSALGSSQIVKSPNILDVMFVVDISGSMGKGADNNLVEKDNFNESPIQKTVNALNESVDKILELNSKSRIGVAVYGTTAAVLLPLDNYSKLDDQPFFSATYLEHYGTQGLHFMLTVEAKNSKDEVIIKYADNAGKSNNDYNHTSGNGTNATYSGTSGYTEGNGTKDNPYHVGHITNQQAGLAAGLKTLADAESTTWISATGQARSNIPCMIHLTDGQASDLATLEEDSNWNNVDINKDIAYTSKKPDGKYNVSQFSGDLLATPLIFQTLMSASYYTSAVNAHYRKNAEEEGVENFKSISIVNYSIYSSASAIEDQTTINQAIIKAINNPMDNFNNQEIKDSSSDTVYNCVKNAYGLFERWKNGDTVNDVYENSSTPQITIELNANKSQLDDDEYNVTVADVIKNINYINRDNFLTSNFDELASKIEKIIENQNAKVTNPIGDNENESGVVNALSYVDPIGKYMDVINIEKVLLFGVEYDVVKGDIETTTSEDGQESTRIYYKIDLKDGIKDLVTNPNYINPTTFKLSDIKIYVEKSKDYDSSWDGQSNSNFDEALNIEIPSMAIPMKTDTIELDAQDEVIKYEDNLKTVKPLRVIYTVGISEDIKSKNGNIDLTQVSNEYFESNKEVEGTAEKRNYVYFYSNFFSNGTYSEEKINKEVNSNISIGNAAVTFAPSEQNRFYYFQKNLTLYSSGKAGIVGEEGEVSEDSVVKKLEDIDKDGKYYFEIDYYVPTKNSDGIEGKQVKCVIERQGSDLKGTDEEPYLTYYDTESKKEVSNPGEHIVVATKVGGKRVGNLKEMNSEKQENKTNTAGTYYVPSYHETNKTVVMYLGNNGRIAIRDALMEITNTVEIPENIVLPEENIKTLQNEIFDFDIKLTKSLSRANSTGEYNVISLKRSKRDTWEREFSKVTVSTNNDGYILGPDNNATEYYVGNSEEDREVNLETGTIIAYDNAEKTTSHELKIIEDLVVSSQYQTTSEFKVLTLQFENGQATVHLKDGEGVLISGLQTGIEYEVVEHDLGELEGDETETQNERGFWFKNVTSNDTNDDVDKPAQTVTGTVTADITDEIDYFNEYALINIPVTKIWNDGDGKNRPKSIEIKVTDQNSDLADEVVMDRNEEDGSNEAETTTNKTTWKHTFALNKYVVNAKKEKELAKYTFEEIIPEENKDKYEAGSFTGSQEEGFTIENTEIIDIPVEKVWEDTEAQKDKRPKSVTFTLTSSDESFEERELTLTEEKNGKSDGNNAKNNEGKDIWSGVFENVPKYGTDGNLVTYTIKENENDNIFYKASNEVTLGGQDSAEIEKIWKAEFKNTFEVPNETVDLEVTKVWADNHNQDGKRPDNIELQIKGDGKIVQGKEDVRVDADLVSPDSDTWKYTVEDLPKYDGNGNVIDYSVEEINVPAEYTSNVSENTTNNFIITNTHTPETTSITVKKVWNDEENRDGIRPSEVTIKVYDEDLKETDNLEDSNVITKIIKSSGDDSSTIEDDWQTVITGLPKYKNVGNEIKYTAEEIDVTSGYTVEVTPNEDNTITLTNTHAPETKEIKVIKEWDDENNHDGKRPESVTIKLFADGQEVKEFVDSKDGVKSPECTLNDSNNWTYIWKNLYKNHNTGNGSKEIEYTVVEESVPAGYTSETKKSEDGSSFTITNSHELEKVKIKVVKEWEDKEEQKNKRPSELTVKLNSTTIENFKEQTAKLELNNDELTYTFEELLRYNEKGELMSYTVTEENPGQFYITQPVTVEVKEDNEEYTATIKNVFERPDDTTELQVTKKWEDNDNQDGIRPQNINLTIKGGDHLVSGEPVIILKSNLVIQDSNESTYKFTDLPKYDDNGDLITYTVEETEVAQGYTYEVSGNMESGFTVTNSHTPETTSVTIKKVWDDDNNRDGLRPQSIKVKLFDSEDTEKATELTTREVTIEDSKDNSDKNTWQVVVDNLPKYKNKGKKIKYTAEEDTLTDYSLSKVEIDEENYVVTLTNNHVPKTTSIKVNKVWIDDDNHDNKRPTSVSIKLLADGKDVTEFANSEDAKAEQILNNENSWTYTWTNLYENENDGSGSKKIQYSVQETEIPEAYSSQITGDMKSGFTVTNTHELETIDIVVEKRWEDTDAQEHRRPNKLIFKLNSDSGEVQDKTLELTSSNQKDEDKDIWTDKFTGLLKYKNGGEPVTYTITEEGTNEFYTSNVSTEIRATEDNKKEYTATITNKFQRPTDTVKVDVTKIWEDSNNHDGIRPDNIDFTITGEEDKLVEKQPVKVEKELGAQAGDTWKYTIDDLPKYDDNGNEIKYTVTEKNVPARYESQVSGDMENGFTVTNTHIPEKINIQVEKKWNDKEEQKHRRSENITIKLTSDYGEGFEEKTLTLSEENNWTSEFKDLYKYKGNGNLATYTVTEETNNNFYTSNDPVIIKAVKEDESGKEFKAEIINTFTRPADTVNVNITKVWEDNNNQDGIRPENVEFTVEGNSTDVSPEWYNVADIKAELQTQDDNQWTYVFNGLPKYDNNGKEIIYKVDEKNVPDGYTKDVSGDMEKGFIVTNTHTPATIDIAVNKVWEDDDNRDGIRPESVDVQVFDAESEDIIVKEITLKASEDDQNWKATISGLPKYKNEGTEIHYSAKEKIIPEGYTSSVSGDNSQGFTIINTHIPKTTSVTVTKVWEDQENHDNKRPENVKIKLLADGEEIEKLPNGQDINSYVEQTLNEANGWNYTWTDLYENKNDAGTIKSIEYTVVETESSVKYESEITGDMKNGFTITNRHELETIDIIVEKNWNDTDSQEHRRPEKLTFKLTSDSEEVEEQTLELTSSNKKDDNKEIWIGEFIGLLKYKNGGEPVTYTITEETPGKFYTSTSPIEIKATEDDKKEYIATITNTFTRPTDTVDVNVTKLWEDANNQDGIRPNSVNLKVTGNGTVTSTDYSTEKEIELEKQNGNEWTYTFTNLPKYDDNGNEITYTVDEESVPDGYTKTLSRDMEKGFIVTNTHEPATIDITVNKVWEDDDNRDCIRPDEITVQLHADDEPKGEPVKLNEENDWTVTIENLPVNKPEGKPIVYTVEELNVPDKYEANINQQDNTFTIINTHIPEKRKIAVTKEWNDKEDHDNERSSSVQVQLYADGEVNGEPVELNEDNHWTYSWTELNKYKNVENAAQEINYTVKEVNVPEGYKVEITGDMENGFKVVNSHELETITIEIEKKWQDTELQQDKRPEEIIFTLTSSALDEVEERTLTLTKDNQKNSNEDIWVGKFENLLKRDKSGGLITYTITEKENKFYKPEDTFEVRGTEEKVSSQTVKVEITNKFQRPEDKITVTVNKEWSGDDGEALEFRPESVTVVLMRNGKELPEIEKIKLEESNGWTNSFENLDVYDESGNKYQYTVKEEATEENDLYYYKENPQITELEKTDSVIKFKITNESNYKHVIVKFQDENGNPLPKKNSDGTISGTIYDVTLPGITGAEFDANEALEKVKESIPEYYELVEVTPEDGKGTFGKDEEVIYTYKLKEYPYKVVYLEKDTEAPELADATTGYAIYGTQIEADKNIKEIKGYNYNSSNPETITINIDKGEEATVNVIKIYYTKRTDLKYTVKYQDEAGNDIKDSKTENGKTYLEEVTETAPEIKGYVLTDESQNTKDLTIGSGENVEDNTITFTYRKKSDLSYKVQYFEVVNPGTEEEQRLEIALTDEITVNNKTFEEIINPENAKDDDENLIKKDIDGFTYKFNDHPDGLIIDDPSENNVLKLYYERNKIGYTVNYYYSWEKAENSYNGIALFEDVINAKDEEKVPSGLKNGYRLATLYEMRFNKIDTENTTIDGFDKDTITIVTDESQNVINVYYVSDENQQKTLTYNLEYYKDGTIDGRPSVNTKEVQVLEPDTLKVYKDAINTENAYGDGYVLDKVEIVEKDGTVRILEKDEEVPSTVNDGTTIKIYYVKRNDLSYTVNYYEQGTSKSLTDSITVYNKTFEDIINPEIALDNDGNAIKKVIDGYNYVNSVPVQMVIGTEENVINLYYVKRSDIKYTVNYYYDWNEEAQHQATATFEEIISIEDVSKVPTGVRTGYRLATLEEMKAHGITGTKDGYDKESIEIVTDETQNIINVYYVRDTFEYTIKYYYSNVEDTSKRVSEKALFGEKIIYEPQEKEGYGFDHVTPKEGSIIITENPENNIIEVYYEKNIYSYTVNYYYNWKKEDIYQEKATFEEIINVTDTTKVPNKIKAGYRLANVDEMKANKVEVKGTTTGYDVDSITITTDMTKNVINVYYVTDETRRKELSYTVKYYKDGVEQTEDQYVEKENVQLLEDDILNVKPDNMDIVSKYGRGYKREKIVVVKPNGTEETVEELPEELESGSTIKVYYVRDTFKYTVEYYYAGVEDESRREVKEALFGETVIYEPKDKEGYSFSYTTPESGSIQIKEYEGANIIRVYYIKNQYSYTVNYYYDGIQDTTQTVSEKADFDTEIHFAEKLKAGYRFEKVSPESGSIMIKTDESKNVINVYYVRKDSSIKVKYVDQVSGKELVAAEIVPGKVFDKHNLTAEKKSFDGYTLVVDPSVSEVEFKEDEQVEVTFYYARTTKVIVKYIEKETNTPLLQQEEIIGWEQKDYATEQKTIPGYTFISDTNNTKGKMTVEPVIEVIYYYAQNTQVTVKHVDKNTGEEIGKDVIPGKSGDAYETKAKDIPGYALVEEPANKNGKMTKQETTVTYYYAKISEGIIEKHIDVKSGAILYNEVHKGNEGDPYDIESRTFEGYDLVTTQLPTNATGTMTVELIEVKYYYIRKATVRTRYVNDFTGESISEDVVVGGHEGDPYTTSVKEIPGFVYLENKKPANSTGTMGVMVNENGDITTEIVVTYYYAPKSGGVVEKHIDVKSGKVLESKTHEGKQRDPYYIPSKQIEGYDLVENQLPANASGSMTENVIEVNYYYIKKAKVIVQYIDKFTGKTLEEVDKQTGGKGDSTEVINGHEDEEYKTKEKIFDNYEIVREEYPSNAQGKMTVQRDKTGKVVEDVIYVKYYYVYNKARVTAKYLDALTGEEISETEVINGKQGDIYEAKQKKIEGYDIVDEMIPQNKTGKMTDGEIEVKYYYIRKARIKVQYLERGTLKKLANDEIIEGHVGDKYELYKKNIKGFILCDTSGNTKGKMTKEDILVTFYYTFEVVSGVGQNITPGAQPNMSSGLEIIPEQTQGGIIKENNIKNKSNIKDLPLTGDNSNIAIIIIGIVVAVNIVQIKLSNNNNKIAKRLLHEINKRKRGRSK